MTLQSVLDSKVECSHSCSAVLVSFYKFIPLHAKLILIRGDGDDESPYVPLAYIFILLMYRGGLNYIEITFY